MLRETLAHAAVDAVGRDDQIGAAVRSEARILGLIEHIHAQRRGAALQDLQQREALDPGKPVARGLQRLPAVMGIDVVPVGEARRGARPVPRLRQENGGIEYSTATRVFDQRLVGSRNGRVVDFPS